MRKIAKKELLISLILLLWTIVTQLFCNIDSYLYAQCGQYDSAWWFMCGKALMNGMTPYVDFADSKGFFLWIIYGLAYLFDEYSYVGVFWIMCLNVWLTLLLSYKISLLWLGKKEALLSVLMLSVLMCHWNFFIETKAEHFCWPSVAYCLYILSSTYKGRKLSVYDCFLIGLAFVLCIMIKWSIALMLCSLIISIAFLAITRKSFKVLALGFVAGTAMLSFLFVAYFILFADIKVFFQEYFIQTLSSVQVPLSETICVYINEIKAVLTDKRVILVFLVLSSFCIIERDRILTSSLVFVSGVFFLLLSIRHDNGHYLWVTIPFSIYICSYIVTIFKKYKINIHYLSVLVLLGMGINVWGNIKYTGEFCTKTKCFDDYMAMSYAMSKVEKPKVVIYMGQERGLALADALPGTRYWCKQMGSTKQMDDEQRNYMLSGKADFVIIWGEDNVKQQESLLFRLGYKLLGCNYAGIVYTKHDICLPEKIKQVTPLQIIFKQNYKQLYSSK